MIATMPRKAGELQLSLFRGSPSRSIAPSTSAGLTMRALVNEVVEKGWQWGDLDSFAEAHFNLRRGTTCCGEKDDWFCRTYHHAPTPCAAAFTPWLEGAAESDLATCLWYRASFAWAVAGTASELDALCDTTAIAFTLDETGAIVAPDDYRPEDALRVGALYEGMTITRFHVAREPRQYMDAPEWWPKKLKSKGLRHEYVRFNGPVTAWIEGAPCLA